MTPVFMSYNTYTLQKIFIKFFTLTLVPVTAFETGDIISI